MDCCNYVPYRNAYYNSQYYENCSYPGFGGGSVGVGNGGSGLVVGSFGGGYAGSSFDVGCDYYGQRYHDYYAGNHHSSSLSSCYGGMQMWPNNNNNNSTAHFSDYVYNPKEARLRKAMREASSRERHCLSAASSSSSSASSSSSTTPASASAINSNRSARHHHHQQQQQQHHPHQQGWMTDEESPLMMSPAHGIRDVIGSPGCGPSFPLAANMMMAATHQMYVHKLNLTSQQQHAADANSYLQPNPIAQLQQQQQQQAEMWHHYHQQEQMQQQTNYNMIHHHLQQNVNPHQQYNPYNHEAGSDLTKMKLEETFVGNRENDEQRHIANENVPPKELTLPDVPHQQQQQEYNQQHYQAKTSYNQQQGGSESFVNVDYREADVGKREATKKSKKKHHHHHNGNQHRNNNQFQQQQQQPPILSNSNKLNRKPLPDFNEAFGATERGRFQSPPDPRLLASPTNGYLDYFFFPNGGGGGVAGAAAVAKCEDFSI